MQQNIKKMKIKNAIKQNKNSINITLMIAKI